MWKEFFYNFLEPISPLFPLIVIVINFRKARATPELLLLFILYFGLFILQMSASVFALFDRPNNIFYSLISIFSFIFISLFFHRIIFSNLAKKLILLVVIPACSFLFIGYTVFSKRDLLFNSVCFATFSIVIIIYCFIYIREKFNLMEYEKISDDYRFWVTASFLVYYIGSFFIFLTFQYLTQSGLARLTTKQIKAIGMLWGLHNFIYFISCLLSAYGLRWKKFPQKYL